MGSNHWKYNLNLSDEERINLRDYREYRQWRKSIYERDKYICQNCGDSNGGNLNAHHINSYSDNPALRLDIDNGITLCELCHHKFHKQYGYGDNTSEQFELFLRR